MAPSSPALSREYVLNEAVGTMQIFVIELPTRLLVRYCSSVEPGAPSIISRDASRLTSASPPTYTRPSTMVISLDGYPAFRRLLTISSFSLDGPQPTA